MEENKAEITNSASAGIEKVVVTSPDSGCDISTDNKSDSKSQTRSQSTLLADSKDMPHSRCPSQAERGKKSSSDSCKVSDPTVSSSTVETTSSSDSRTVAHKDHLSDRRMNAQTATESSMFKQDRCKYCELRLSMLQRLDQTIGSSRSSQEGKGDEVSAESTRETRDAVSQTPAMLIEGVEMSRDLPFGRSQFRSETFCKCVMRNKEKDCRCGENQDDKYFEWVWDAQQGSQASTLQEGGRQAIFHKDYSCGTSAVRGQQVMDRDQHFWEIKMNTPVYGTDMMVGVGTENVALNAYHHSFCSMLGQDMESWGLSYDGKIQHGGYIRPYCSRFGQGTVIGVHLDMWHGTLTFFKNRQNLGVAFKGLRGRRLYPMACSTAARSGMRITCTRSFPTSLQYLCCRRLRQFVPAHLSVLEALAMPPGLRMFLANNMTWLLDVPHDATDAHDYVCSVCMPLRKLFEDCPSQPEERKRSFDEAGHFLSHHFNEQDEDSDNGEEAVTGAWIQNYLREMMPSSSSSSSSSSLSSDSQGSRFPSHSYQLFSRVLSTERPDGPVVKKSKLESESGNSSEADTKTEDVSSEESSSDAKEDTSQKESTPSPYKGLGKRKKTD